METHGETSQRLYLTAPLCEGAEVDCSAPQANYLLNVLRLGDGDRVRVFNGRDGEWLAGIVSQRRKDCRLAVISRLRPQISGPDVDYLFAPLKHARLDYMVQKATEMGVRRLRPVITRRTIASRVNLERMAANAIEAAEQCGLLAIPEIADLSPLESVLERWDPARRLIFCDESAEVATPLAALKAEAKAPLAVLIGPEGGFDPGERAKLLAQPYTLAISLGPRIMRADTAAVAALALVNTVTGEGW